MRSRRARAYSARAIPGKTFVAISFLVSFSGCGLIFGGSQQADNKSHDYSAFRLEKQKGSEWVALKPSSSSEEASDLAYEHPKSGSIISLNSNCREPRESSLEDLTRYLMLGLNTTNEPSQREIEIDETKALESTVDAKSNDDTKVRIRTIVLRKNGCTYDMLYIARPEHFNQLLSQFDQFSKGFHAN